MAMLPLLRNFPGYTLASTFRLRPSVLHIATRNVRTTSSSAKKAGEKANSKPTTAQKSDGKISKKKSDNPKPEKPAKPKRFTKKDLTPPSKRPMTSFAAFALEFRAKQQQNTDPQTNVPLADSLRGAAAAWADLSEAEKQKYVVAREAFEAHKVALKNWEDSLSIEAKRALKLRRRRVKGTGHDLFISETFKEAEGDTFGERISDRAAVWRSLSSEAKEAYAKRAANTLFGVRAKRAAQHERQLAKEAKKKAEAAAAKDKKKAEKPERAKKPEQAKLRKVAAIR